MNLFPFVVLLIIVGLAFIYFFDKLPKPVTVFLSVFAIMSVLYWAVVFVKNA